MDHLLFYSDKNKMLPGKFNIYVVAIFLKTLRLVASELSKVTGYCFQRFCHFTVVKYYAMN